MTTVPENPAGPPIGPPNPPERPEGLPPRPEPPRPVWPVWSAFVALVAGWLGGSVLGAIVYAIAGASGYHGSKVPVGYDLVANLLFDGCLVASAIFFARLGGRVAPATFGLRRTRFWPAVGVVAAGYVTYLVLSAIWVQAVHIQNEKDEISKQLSHHPAAATVAGMALFAVVVAPIVEEVFFRGFVFPSLRAKIGVGWGAIGTGVLFGVVHAFGSPIGFLLPLALLGTILCLVYWRTGSLYPCIALHAINNCFALGGTLDWNWQIPLLVLGSLSAIAAILVPISRIGRHAAAPA